MDEPRGKNGRVYLQKICIAYDEVSGNVSRAYTKHMKYLFAEPDLFNEHTKVQDDKAGSSWGKTSGCACVPDGDHG
jgi:hypothetical protein